MATYNSEEYVEEAINSILKQTHNNIEFIICDDGSTDNTFEVISKYRNIDPRIRLFKNEFNMGLVKTRNKMFSLVSGSYITFLDADDISSINRLELLLEAIISENLDIVGSNAVIIDDAGYELNRTNYPSEIVNLDLMVTNKAPFFVGSSILFKRELLSQVSGYSVYFDRIGSEDVDFIYRILKKFKFRNLLEPLYLYRMTENSLSRTNFMRNALSLYSDQLARDLYEYRKLPEYNELGEEKFVDSRKKEYLDNFVKDKGLVYEKLLFNVGLFNSKKNLMKYISSIPKFDTTFSKKCRLVLRSLLYLTFGYKNLANIKKHLKN